MNALIIAAGNGSRLWPASRKHKPKQLLSFMGESTMIEKTYNRVRKAVGPENVFVAVPKRVAEETKLQLPEVPVSQFLFEPIRKNRGPVLGLLMLYLKKYSKDPYFTTVWCDDHIAQEDIYASTIKSIEKYLQQNPNQTVAIGISPDHPNTSFRYVQAGDKINSDHLSVYKVDKFTEFPDQSTAQEYYESGKHFWNAGYFFSTVDNILSLYKEYYPECYEVLMQLEPYIGTDQQNEKIDEIYPNIPKFDFEHLFIEKPELLHVVPANFHWRDLGKWNVIKDVQSSVQENLTKGLTVSHGTEGSLVFNYNPDQLVSTLHVENLVIVVTKEAVLVADKDKTGDIKKIISQLEDNEDLRKFL